MSENSNFGIINISLACCKEFPTHKSQLLTQLLYGETFEILDSKEAWVFIKNYDDGYQGWINILQYKVISEQEYKIINNRDRGFVKNITKKFVIDSHSLDLPFGSYYPFDIYDGEKEDSQMQIIEYAKKFVNAPYMWGGKTCFGIDCSGFTQVIYKLFGIRLPRDTSYQVKKGSSVDYKNLKEADLIFFSESKSQLNKITHVGIYLSNQEIIHASNKVQIDKLTEQGIYNSNLDKYTHYISKIRRVI